MYGCVEMKLTTITYHKSYETEQLIDWCLTPTLAVFQLYRSEILLRLVLNTNQSIDTIYLGEYVMQPDLDLIFILIDR
jgi:hypothetical protein